MIKYKFCHYNLHNNSVNFYILVVSQYDVVRFLRVPYSLPVTFIFVRVFWYCVIVNIVYHKLSVMNCILLAFTVMANGLQCNNCSDSYESR